jgi:hypothetical protein
MASLPPSTSAQIAEAAGLSERHLREWLAAMTTGGIVDHDPDQLTFTLPPDRAGWLTRAAGSANLALQAQYVGLIALVEDQIVECHGGGLPYSAYPKFHALMAEESGASSLRPGGQYLCVDIAASSAVAGNVGQPLQRTHSGNHGLTSAWPTIAADSDRTARASGSCALTTTATATWA